MKRCAVGESVDKIEEANAARAKRSEGSGALEAKVLFEEQDGIWLHMQGKDRKEYGESKEMKLAIAYDGAKQTGKKRYELTNKVACANFEGVDKFYRRKEGVIAANYNVDEIVTRVRQSLEEVGMWEYHAHEPHRLSGGQKQRVAIAGVLAMRPECIVLDEPTAMLDPRGRREVMDTLLRLRRDEGMTLVLITHFMEEAALADTLVVMDAGHVVLTGAPLQVFSQVDRIRALGLDAPAGAELLTRLRASGMDIPRLALTARDCAEILAEVLTGTG